MIVDVDEQLEVAATGHIFGCSKKASHFDTGWEYHVDNNKSHALKIMSPCLSLHIIKRDTSV